VYRMLWSYAHFTNRSLPHVVLVAMHKALKTTDKLQRSKIGSRITPIARLHNGCTNVAAIATHMY